jgi:hypothetical protein
MTDNCERCGEATLVTIMSMFNTQIICLDCEEEEKKDPRYEEARKAEAEACLRGEFSFPGTGW